MITTVLKMVTRRYQPNSIIHSPLEIKWRNIHKLLVIVCDPLSNKKVFSRTSGKKLKLRKMYAWINKFLQRKLKTTMFFLINWKILSLKGWDVWLGKGQFLLLQRCLRNLILVLTLSLCQQIQNLQINLSRKSIAKSQAWKSQKIYKILIRSRNVKTRQNFNLPIKKSLSFLRDKFLIIKYQNKRILKMRMCDLN